MIIDDFDLERVAIAELEANSPGTIRGHRPLALPIASELVQADTLQGAQVLQRRGGIQRRQELACRVDIKAPVLCRLAVFRKAASRGVAPGLDHRIKCTT